MIDYKQLLANFVSKIRDLSDSEFQERVWVRGLGPECSSFGDSVDDFFDYCDSIIQDYKLFGLTEIQCEALKTFALIFREYADTVLYGDVPDSEIVNDPEWDKVRTHAKELFSLFKLDLSDYRKVDPYYYKKQMLQGFIDNIAILANPEDVFKTAIRNYLNYMNSITQDNKLFQLTDKQLDTLEKLSERLRIGLPTLQQWDEIRTIAEKLLQELKSSS